MLDDEHPDAGVVDQPVPERKLRRFVQTRFTLLLNQVRSVRDCLLNELHHVGFGLVNVSRRVMRVLGEFGPEL